MKLLGLLALCLVTSNSMAGKCSEFSKYNRGTIDHLENSRCKVLRQNSSYTFHKSKNKIVSYAAKALSVGNEYFNKDNIVIKYGTELVQWASDNLSDGLNKDQMHAELYNYFMQSKYEIKSKDFKNKEDLILSSNVLNHIEETLSLVEKNGGDPEISTMLYLSVLNEVADQLVNNQAQFRNDLENKYVSKKELENSMKKSAEHLAGITKKIESNKDSEDLIKIKNALMDELGNLAIKVSDLSSLSINTLKEVSILQKQLSELKKQGKENSELFKKLEKKLIETTKDQSKQISKRKLQYENARAATAIFSSVLTILGQGEYAQQFDVITNNAINISQAIEQITSQNLLSSTTSGSLVPYATIATGALSIYNLFNKTKTADQVILEQLQAISKQINNLRIEMHDRFDNLELILSQQHEITMKALEKIYIDQQNAFENINETLAAIDSKSIHILETLQKYTSEELELKLKKIEYSCIDYSKIYSTKMPEENFNDCMLDISHWVIDYSILKAFTGVQTNDTELAIELINDDNIKLKYSTLARIINTTLGTSIPENIPNIYLWTKGIEFYFIMQDKYPEYAKRFDRSGLMLRRMIDSGQKLSNFFKKMSSPEIREKLIEHIKRSNSETEFHIELKVYNEFENYIDNFNYEHALDVTNTMSYLAKHKYNEKQIFSNALEYESSYNLSSAKERKEKANCSTKIGNEVYKGCQNHRIYKFLNLEDSYVNLEPAIRLAKPCHQVMPSLASNFTKKNFQTELYLNIQSYGQSPMIPKIFSMNELYGGEKVELCYNIEGQTIKNVKGGDHAQMARRIEFHAIFDNKVINSTSAKFKRIGDFYTHYRDTTNCNLYRDHNSRLARIQASILGVIDPNNINFAYTEKCSLTSDLRNNWKSYSFEEQKHLLGQENVNKLKENLKSHFIDLHNNALASEEIKTRMKTTRNYTKMLRNLIQVSNEPALYNNPKLANVVLNLDDQSAIIDKSLLTTEYSGNLYKALSKNVSELEDIFNYDIDMKPGMLRSLSPTPYSFEHYFTKLVLAYHEQQSTIIPIIENNDAYLVKELIKNGQGHFIYNVSREELRDVLTQIVVTPSYSRDAALKVVEKLSRGQKSDLIKDVINLVNNTNYETVKSMGINFLSKQKETIDEIENTNINSKTFIAIITPFIPNKKNVKDYCFERLLNDQHSNNQCLKLLLSNPEEYADYLTKEINKKGQSLRRALYLHNVLDFPMKKKVVNNLIIDSEMTKLLDQNLRYNFRSIHDEYKDSFSVTLPRLLRQKLDDVSKFKEELELILSQTPERDLEEARRLFFHNHRSSIQVFAFNQLVSEKKVKLEQFNLQRTQRMAIFRDLVRLKEVKLADQLVTTFEDFYYFDTDMNSFLERYYLNNTKILAKFLGKVNLYELNDDLSTKLRVLAAKGTNEYSTILNYFFNNIDLNTSKISVTQVTDSIEEKVTKNPKLKKLVYRLYFPLARQHKELEDKIKSYIPQTEVSIIELPYEIYLALQNGYTDKKAKDIITLLSEVDLESEENTKYKNVFMIGKITIESFYEFFQKLYEDGKLPNYKEEIKLLTNSKNVDVRELAAQILQNI